MKTLASLVALVLHAGLMAVMAPLLTGALAILRARLAGQAGPPLLQPFRDLRRLARKQPVLPESATLLLPAAPLVALGAMAVAAALVPSFTLGMLTAPCADLLVLAGLLATARVAMALAGFDAGTALGGMGASRAMSLAVLTEPALLLALFTIAMLAGSTNIDSAAAALRDGGTGLRVSLGLALAAASVVALVDAGRFGSEAGLGLGLGGEPARLALSGWHLAAAELAAALRLLVWLSLLIAMFVPAGIASADAGVLAWGPGLLAWAVKLAVLLAALALVQTSRPALRWRWVPELLGIALVLGVLAAVFLFVGQGLA